MEPPTDGIISPKGAEQAPTGVSLPIDEQSASAQSNSSVMAADAPDNTPTQGAVDSSKIMHDGSWNIKEAWVGGNAVAVKKTSWPAGPMQMFKLVKAVPFTCLMCKKDCTDYRIVTLDRRWDTLICGPCYDGVVKKRRDIMNRTLDKVEGRIRPDRGLKRGAPDDGERSAKQPRLEGEAEVDRVPKRMCALLIGYRGTRYCGLQINPDVLTVEQVVLDALMRAEYIPPSAPGDLHKYSWQRASRTDKGVHAARNVLSVRLRAPKDLADETIVTRLNAELPEDVRVFACTPTTKRCNVKQEATHRTYQYMVPTFAFLADYSAYFPRPLEDFVVFNARGAAPAAEPDPGEPGAGGGGGDDDDDGPTAARASKQEDDFRLSDIPLPEGCFQRLCQYRLPAPVLAEVRRLLRMYEGTHRYHNFTKGLEGTAPQSQRFVTSFTCSDPYERDGLEMVTLEVRGQSFLFNQIRKMVGLVMIAVSSRHPPGLLESAFRPDTRLNIPPAPPAGLLLLDIKFDKYSDKLANCDAARQPLEWPGKAAEVEAFKGTICNEIVAVEHERQVVCRWMYALRRNVHKFLKLELFPGGTAGGSAGVGEQGAAPQEEGAQGGGAQGEGAQGEGAQGGGAQGEGAQGEGAQGEGAQGEGGQGEGAQGEGTQGEG